MSRRKRNRVSRDPIEAHVHALSHDGRGIASIDGKTTFILGALPDETVMFTLLKRNSKFDEGVVSEILTPSPDRIGAACPHFTNCGGCRLQHMPTDLQVSMKESTFKELMQHHAEMEPAVWAQPLSAESWNYRRKARLSVRYVAKKERVLVGFRELNGRFVADNRQCPILIKPVDQLIDALSQLILGLTARESIPQIEIAAGDDSIALLFRHLEALSDTDELALVNFGKEHNLRIYLQPKGYDSLRMAWPENTSPLLSYKLPTHELEFHFKPEHFVQVNAQMNALMLAQAIDWLEISENDRVLDLFCGIGNFSLPLAKKCAHVTGVEGCDSSVNQAKANAKHNAITNADFYTCNLFELPSKADWIDTSHNKMLLDPPRAGAQEIVMHIKRFDPAVILYVSCHPATLARDSKILGEQGYKLEKAGIMDMFPHTQHVEAMALFRRS